MICFKINKVYDIITILFNSIWYLNEKELKSTIKNVYNHLNKWGIFLIETAFIKDIFNITGNRRIYKDWDINIIRDIWIKYYKDNIVLKAKYLINTNTVIEEDEQKVHLFRESEIVDFFKSVKFKIKTYHHRKNKSTIFVWIK